MRMTRRRAAWTATIALLAVLALSCTPSEPEVTVRSEAPLRPTPTPASELPPVDIPDDAVRLERGDDFQSVVDGQPPGTAFVIAAGEHRLQQVIPRDGDRFIGESGAVMKGSRLMTGFVEENGLYVASDQTQGNEIGETGFMEPGRERDAFPEELFYDGHRLEHVGGVDQVVPGTWFFDYDADRIYMADDPAAGRVETSVTEFAFGGSARDVVIENLSVRQYANRAQLGAIHGETAEGWTIVAVDSSFHHGSGIHLGPGWTVTNSRFTYNGQIGMNADGQLREDAPIVVRQCEIAQNKQLGYDWEWEGGAGKYARTIGMVFEHNWVHDNIGPGPWFDIDNREAVIRSNLVEGNSGVGIHYEINYGGEIYWNEVRGNGHDNDEYGTGIFISNSSDVEVFENLLYDNRNEIFALQDDRGAGEFGPRIVANLDVHDNDVTVTDGAVGLRVPTDEDEYYTSRGVQFRSNTYRIGDADGDPFYWNGDTVDAEQWQELGLDVDGEILDESGPGQLPAEADAFTPARYGPR